MKLYVILRQTLDAGLKCAQAVHAAILFGEEYPHLKNYWYHESNNVVVLQEEQLDSLADRLEAEGFRLSRFHEPDRDGELTAICVEPDAWRHLSSLPLAA